MIAGERRAAFVVEICEYRGVVRVPRRVFRKRRADPTLRPATAER